MPTSRHKQCINVHRCPNKVHVEKDWFTSQVDDDDQSANEEPPVPPARKKVQTVTELD